jgi:hypothetical protein
VPQHFHRVSFPWEVLLQMRKFTTNEKIQSAAGEISFFQFFVPFIVVGEKNSRSAIPTMQPKFRRQGLKIRNFILS